MAYNFSANQFEDGYQPKRLRNWEIPKWYPEPHKKQHSTTKFVANSRGHLLPGIPRCNPWSNFRGTWDLPNRITRKIADDLTSSIATNLPFRNKKKAPKQIKPQIEESGDQKLPDVDGNAQNSFLRRNKSCPALEPTTPVSCIEQLKPDYTKSDLAKTPDITPGTIDDKLKLLLTPSETKQPEPGRCKASDSLIASTENDVCVEIANPKPITPESMALPSKPTVCSDYPAYQIAKRYHDENLKHQPLPDVIDDINFQFLANNRHPYPALGLKNPTSTTAIGMKHAGATGPTKCSKIKIYRPKTAMNIAKVTKPDTRPKTTDSKKISQIDLAIRWDLKPNVMGKKKVHIDGSNGGEAPAVFSMVQQDSKVEENVVASSAQPVAEYVKPCTNDENVGTLPSSFGKPSHANKVINRGAIMAHISPPSRTSTFHSLTPISAEIARKHPKTAWSNEDTSKALAERLQELENKSKSQSSHSSESNSNLSKDKHYQSTPNLELTKNDCNGSKCGSYSPKRDNKALPIKNGCMQNGVKMPKMRPPFQKKNYAISTLIPPFSLWPDHNGQEYPEHWRLASIYQHSYKPVDYRRKPLLASVYQ